MEYIKIDLHVHSIDSSKTGSNISKNSDDEMLVKLKENKVRVTSFVDHDCFYYASYLKRIEIIKKYEMNILILPGIEVNLKRFDNKKGQAIFVFNPNNDLLLLENITKKYFWFSNKKYTYSEAVEIFEKNNFDFMVFPHSGKAQDNMAYEDIKESQIDGLDTTNPNSSNNKKILKYLPNLPKLFFSDTHTWKKYPEHSKFWTYLQIKDANCLTYEEIKQNIKNNLVEIKEIYSRRKNDKFNKI
ncbi:PHP domain-containing protein [Metamycoplasma canadense]|uniref:Polymerase/histidinol phosphatase N-terminal domain-containing protein n=1 Tax=Metamycoplasma canadense TaxID=29554 RepID=A0A077L9U4_9BACT|nr:PHP domain-containing protein [Metamycoplasma canadense]BAP39798.1 hypothetical protein MCAN360_0781 [Metamycoplasma canadense]